MKLCISKSKNSTIFYIGESFRDNSGRSTTRTVGKIGTLKELQEKLGPDVDVKEWCKEYVRKLNDRAKAGKAVTLKLELPAGQSYEKGEQRSFNVGYLMLRRVFNSLGLAAAAADIASRYKFDFDLGAVLGDLVYARLLDPQSKPGSYDYCNTNLYEKPQYQLHDVYRALDVIAKENNFLQSSMYKASLKTVERNTSVLYYDCTNFFFETAGEDELRKYGQSKENRPNPLVQLGLFTDGSGMPLAFNLTPDNRNEQITMVPLEKQILKDFALAGAKLTVCADAGLCSKANKAFNSRMNRSFIVIRPIKKMSGKLQEWALDRGRSLELNPLREDENPDKVRQESMSRNWQCSKLKGYFALDDLDEDDEKLQDLVFYKERYIVDEETHQTERLIVTYSIKYKHFMQKKRVRDMEKAQKLINRKLLKHSDLKKNDVTRYIKVTNTTADGIEAAHSSYELDLEEAAKQALYDGFYAVSTSYDMKDKTAAGIADINKGRWEIEESFMLLKSEFKSRPVYLHKSERILAHFIICFITLTVFRALEQMINKGRKENYTARNIIKTLRSMNITKIGSHYTGAFTRTDLTDALHELTEMRFDCELITESMMKKQVKQSQKIFTPLK